MVFADFLHLNHPVFRIGRSIEDMNRSAFKQHATDRTLPARLPGCVFHDILEGRRIAVGRLCAEKIVASRTSNISDIGLTQSCCRLQKGVEHCLQIEGGAADDLEHVGGSGLLLQRFRQIVGALMQFLQQSDVLDGDDRLRREHLQQVLMLFRGGASLSPVSHNRA
jgi:hypothetical protein